MTRMTNTNQRNDLVKLLAELRVRGEKLPVSLLDLHETLCEQQREASERVQRLERELETTKAHLQAPAEELNHGTFELHLSPALELTQSQRNKIKSLGGGYTECRGYSQTRFVKIPNTAEGRELSAHLLNENSKPASYEGATPRPTVCILRSFGINSDGHLRRVDWTPEILLKGLHICNRKAMELSIADIIRSLSSARENL